MLGSLITSLILTDQRRLTESSGWSIYHWTCKHYGQQRNVCCSIDRNEELKSFYTPAIAHIDGNEDLTSFSTPAIAYIDSNEELTSFYTPAITYIDSNEELTSFYTPAITHLCTLWPITARLTSLAQFVCQTQGAFRWDIQRPTSNWHPMEHVWAARGSPAGGWKAPDSKAWMCSGGMWYDNVYQRLP